MLQVVIGLIFVLLLLSLLATTVMEWIAGLFKLRGRTLERALRNMLSSADGDESVFRQFSNNPMYRQLTENPRQPSSRPSYMRSDTFRTILLDILGDKDRPRLIEELEKSIEKLPDADLKQVLRSLLREAGDDMDAFKTGIQEWYDLVMDRVSGWYKRYTQRILLFLGVVIAIVFNADTLAIYQSLERNPEQLRVVLEMANAFLQEDYSRYAPYLDESTVDADSLQRVAARDLVRELQQELKYLKAPLGMGWHSTSMARLTPGSWLIKMLGWFVTALAISLGAPFWFDLLRKLTHIRSAGKKE